MHYAWRKRKKNQCKTSFYLKRVREVPVKPKVKVSEGNRCSNYSGRVRPLSRRVHLTWLSTPLRTLLLLLFAGTIFCEFLRFGKNRKIKYPQKFLPTHLALWCKYNHKLRDVCHFRACIIILFWSFMPFLFLFPLPSRACESDVWWYRSWEFHEQNSNSVPTGRITGARCTICHVSCKSKQRLHCSKFSK